METRSDLIFSIADTIAQQRKRQRARTNLPVHSGRLTAQQELHKLSTEYDKLTSEDAPGGEQRPTPWQARLL